MSSNRNNVFINFIQATFRVCLMMVIVVSLQGNFINDVFDFFNIDTIELSEDVREKENESESEESDVDDHLYEKYGYGYLTLSLVKTSENTTSKITSHKTSILTPPPDWV